MSLHRRNRQQLERAAEAGLVGALFELGELCCREGLGAQAVRWYRRAADSGHTGAMVKLGLAYQNGDGVPQDSVEAISWFRLAADLGFALGMVNLGLAYEKGTGIRQDFAQAVSWYRQAAVEGDSVGMLNLGRCLREGIGTSKDENQAVEWFRRAAEMGNSGAMFFLGVSYANGHGVSQDENMAAAWYTKAAKLGDADAMVNLGVSYHSGKGVPQDAALAVRWWRKAAEMGQVAGMSRLGWAYSSGNGVAEDRTLAVGWYKKAAELGNADGMFLLGLAHANGEGVPEDWDQAVHWWRRAAELGDTEAMYMLGVCLSDRLGTSENEEAIQWLQRAAEAGHIDAMVELAKAYANGKVVAQNATKAFEWFRKAAELGNAGAMLQVGIAFGEGKGVPQENAQAVSWFRKAADLGNTQAMIYLGLGFEEEDVAQTIHWYKQAAEMGNTKGMLFLGGLFHDGERVRQDFAKAVYWYGRAAEAGHPLASGNLAVLARGGAVPHEIQSEAVSWLRRAAEVGHSEANIELAKISETKPSESGTTTQKRNRRKGAVRTQRRTSVSSTPQPLNTDALAELHSLIALSGVKEEVRRFAAFLKIQQMRASAGLPTDRRTLHFVFTGNPGTGKTTVARILGKILCGYGILKQGHVVETDRSGLVAKFLGETALKTDKKVTEALDGVLFIDEAYNLAKGTDQDSFGQEAIATLLKRMEDNRDRLVVIAAGYPEPMEKFIQSNPGFESRFTRFLRFEDYSVTDLCRIFQKSADEQHYVIDAEARARLVLLFTNAYASRNERFGNGRFARNIFEDVIGRQADRLTALSTAPTREDLRLITAADVPLDATIVPDGQLDTEAATWIISCPSCGTEHRIKTKVIGAEIRCGKCGVEIVVDWPSMATSFQRTPK